MPTQNKHIWIWSAIYDDNTVICEYDSADSRKFADVDGSRVKALDIEPLHDGSLAAHRVLVPQGAVPVFFRRGYTEISLVDGSETPRGTVHCIGWQRGEEAVYLFVFEDGSTLLTNELQAV